MEYLNLYDKNGNLLKEKGIRGEKSDNLVGIVIIFVQNSNGEFWIQKTSKNRNSIYATTGGHVSYGDDFIETVIKEMKEELNIDINKNEIQEINTYIRDYYIQKVYYTKKDIDIKNIKVQKSEVDFVEWLSIEKIKELIKNNCFREGNIEAFNYIITNICKWNKGFFINTDILKELDKTN